MSTPKQIRNSDTNYVPLLPEDPLVDKSCDRVNSAFGSYPKERRKTLMTVGLMFLCAYFNGAVTALISDLVPRTPLPDLIFEHIPEQQWAWSASDTIVITLGSLMITFGVLHKHRWIVCRRFCFITGQLYLLRGICMGVTWLAIPGRYQREHCVELADPKEYWYVVGRRVARFLLTFGVFPVGNGNQRLCGDYIFSGHTLVIIVSWYTVSLYLPSKKCRPILFAFKISSMIGMVLIVLCRMHYTVDVILAFIISSSFYAVYHLIISLPNDDRQWINRLKYMFWMLPMVPYFEANVPSGNVPRKLEWPLSKPSLCRKFLKSMNDF